MSHQSQVENAKYRNWVKGQLAFKYLKDGIQNFTDEVIRKEHEELLKRNGITSHQTCGQCTLKDLLPLHESILDNHSNKRQCKRGQKICNCINPKHKKSCPNKICDVLYEEILNSHASSPPLPEWRNTDISKWCTDPWEIAKCYINAPGYSTKHSAKDIDTNGLLHVFINNISYQDHFLDVVLFKEIREKRNQLIHSSAVEMEDYELWGWINDIIMLLEDGKELKHAGDAKNAVLKIKELKERSLIITTYEEAEVCREAMEELKEVKFKTELACNDITIRLQLIEDTSIRQQHEYEDQSNALADIQQRQQSSRSELEVLTEREKELLTRAHRITKSTRTAVSEALREGLSVPIERFWKRY